ncbi:MAG: hypothetical protein PVJ39_21780 [Gammaproteobacteria bacterium]
MNGKVAMFSLIVTVSAFLPSYADGDSSTQDGSTINASLWNDGVKGTDGLVKVASRVESAADKLYSQSFAMFEEISGSRELDAQSCDTDDTAVVTIYSTNGMAQHEIDVNIDGSPVGSLTTYFPDDEPGCKTPSADGVITLMVPAGKHTLEATSPNLNWPSHHFSIEKCECMSLPLS